MRRLFAAVWPAPPLMDGLGAMARPARPGLGWATRDQWHVTVRFFGSVDPSGEAALHDGLASMAWPPSPVLATAGPRPVALGRHVWVLPVEGLAGRAAAVEAATAPVVPMSAEESGRRFRGHLTLARLRTGSFAGPPVPDLACRWAVGAITLVSSELHPEGARYRIVGRWGPGEE